MKNYTITVNGVAYDVTVEENSNSAPRSAPVKTEEPVQAAAPAPAVKAGNVSIEAPMPGNVLDITVKPGQTVKTGEALIILEAMKMENEIVAPSDGEIASIVVSKGDSVEAGQVLITLN